MRGAPPCSDLHREDIKAAIRKRGLTLLDVCSLVDGEPVTKQAVSEVLAGRTTSARIETALALASGYTLAEVQQVTRVRPFAPAGQRDTQGDTRPSKTSPSGRMAA